MNDLRKEALSVMSKAETVEFSTINEDGYPVTRAMFNFANSNKFPALSEYISGHSDIFLGTNTFLAKVAQTSLNRKCSVYYFLPNESRGVLIWGDAEIIHDLKIKQNIWQSGWEKYYPGGVEDPDFTVIRIKPAAVKGYRQLSHYRIEGNEWAGK